LQRTRARSYHSTIDGMEGPMVATLTQSKKQTPARCRLLESLDLGKSKVDRKAGVIRHVKIVGIESRNTGRTIGLDPAIFEDAVDRPYSYDRDALQRAIPLYEGATVRIDHPLTERGEDGRRIVRDRTRSTLSLAGKLTNVVLESDGLYGDLQLLKTGGHFDFLLEIAETMPDKIALSHNADGRPVLRDGYAVIEEIRHVHSVDIVSGQPGTTNGLFEDYMPVKKTIRQIINTIPKKTLGHGLLLEMAEDMFAGSKIADMVPPGMEGMAPGMEPPPEQQVADALRTVVMAIYDDPMTDDAAKLSKIKEIFRVKAKMDGKSSGGAVDGSGAPPFAGGEGEEDEGTETTETKSESDEGSKKPPEKDKEENPLEESMTATVNDPKIKSLIESAVATAIEPYKKKEADRELTDHCRGLLESADREISDLRVKALKALGSDEDRKALIETWPGKDDLLERKPGESRAQLLESAMTEQAKDVDEFVSSIRNRML
jgi:hypothetical protein